MLRHGPGFGLSNASLAEASDQWDALIQSSYMMLEEAQCESSGLVPNWWRPAGPRNPQGAPGCNHSGTPADEFGSEAARSVWRVAVDALWSGSAEAVRFTARVARQVTSRLDEAASNGAGFQPLAIDESCTSVRTVHQDWYWNAFMFAPIAAALVLPLPHDNGSGDAGLAERQQRALSLLSERIATGKITQYYSGAWLAIATPTLNGDLAAACNRVLGGECAPKGRRLLTPLPARASERLKD